ncbi:MAG: hypothetical protein ACREEB_05085, partial [Caulobacteraceae bacterium]
NDPVGRKLMQLVMTDEAFHHKFGKIWADRTVPKLTAEEHAIVEDWAAHCFQTLLFNLVAPHQMKDIYARFGLDPDKVMEGFQAVATDEAFHHKFGKIWADRTVPKLTAEEHAIVEDWAAHCFQSVLFNLVSPSEQRDLYVEFGLDPDKVLDEIQKIATDEARREDMKRATNIFRVLIKTLLNAGIITDRTRAFYGMYVDMDELKSEGDRMVGDDIAEEGIAYLKTINFRERSVTLSMAAE